MENHPTTFQYFLHFLHFLHQCIVFVFISSLDTLNIKAGYSEYQGLVLFFDTFVKFSIMPSLVQEMQEMQVFDAHQHEDDDGKLFVFLVVQRYFYTFAAEMTTTRYET